MYDADNLGDEAMRDAGLAILPQGRVIPYVNRSKVRAVDWAIRARRRRHLVIGGGTLIHGASGGGSSNWLDYV
jgi:hypothetical protein